MKRFILLLTSYVSFFFLNACNRKTELSYWDASNTFFAVIMQNKVHGINPFREGQFYAVKHNDGNISTLYTSISGLDNIYQNGYQYTVELEEVCRIYQTAQYLKSDSVNNGCILNLIRIISKYEVAEEFIVPNLSE